VFFQSTPSVLERELESAVKTPPPGSEAEATTRAKAHAASVRAATSALKPNVVAFGSAAAVFIFLVVAAYLTASAADSQTSTTATQLKDLSNGLSELLVAWSGAVLGLIGGEAVGKKSAP
jgi:hypothetical protein